MAYRFDPPQFDVSRVDPAVLGQIKSYLYRLNDYLGVALESGQLEVTGGSRTANWGQGSGAKLVPMDAETRKKFEELSAGLRKQILDTAEAMSLEFNSRIEVSSSQILTTVEEWYATKSEVGQLQELTASQFEQTSRDITASFTKITQVEAGAEQKYAGKGEVSDLAASTAEQIGAVQDEVAGSREQIGQVEAGLDEYIHTTETYIRFSEAGIEIGKRENDQSLPFSMKLDNERLTFYQFGVPVAYFKYNKLYVTSGEFLDRFSVGSSANGGFFDFITTATGLGIKWREE